MSSKLKNILKFAKLGIPILPLAPTGIEPAVVGGVKAAVTDPKTLQKFFSKHADYNYGLATEAGTFVVSAEDKRAKSRLVRLASQSGSLLPKTVTLRIDTSRYYVFRSEGVMVRSSRGCLGKGIDVYGDGGLVLGPGSRLASGSTCRFADGRSLGDLEIAQGPKWLLDAIGTEPVAAQGSMAAPSAKSKANAGHPNIVNSAEDAARPATTAGAQVVSIPLSAIFVDPKHPIDPEHVQLLESSIGVLGLRTPITVRRKESNDKFEVVTGHARFIAMKNRDCDRIEAFIMEGDERDARLWGIAEDVDRRVPSVFEVAERTREFDLLLQAKLDQVVQDAPPPGGAQPRDQGIRKAARQLGISREQMRRRRLICGLSGEAKVEARALGLDDNQSALLEAAREETAEQQVSKLRERASRRRHRRHSGKRSAAENGSSADGQNEQAEPRQHDVGIGGFSADAREAAQAATRGAAHSDELSIPPFLRRLDSAQETLLAQLLEPFDRELMPKLVTAPPVVREQFVEKVAERVRVLNSVNESNA